MGVRGLQTYIREREDTFLCNYKLCDTKLIIDGPNLMHCLYEFYGIPSNLGGNYDQFAKECEEFIHSLRRCRVEPIVIFDGADDPTDIKLETNKQRLDDRTKDVTSDNDDTSILPILAEITFKRVLVKLQVEHACCLFEADWQIASLANKFGCPVLSGDTDFNIFDLRIGCIYPKDLFDSMKTPPSLEYLSTKIYNCRVLIEMFNMGSDDYVLPVFATLVGNDYFDSRKSKFKNPNNSIDTLSKIEYESSVNTESGNNTNVPIEDYVQFTINWINRVRFSSGEDAFENLAEQLTGKEKNHFTMSVQSYLNVKSDAEPGIVFDLLEEIKRTELIRNSDNIPYFPEWLMETLIKCENNTKYLLNIVLNRRLMFKSQVENHKRPPSFACSNGIRRVIYGLLIGQMPKKQRKIEEYHRSRSGLSNVLPITNLRDFPKLPHVTDIVTFNASSRRALLYAIFGNMSQFLPEEMEDTSKIVIFMISLWKKNSCATQVQLEALVICFFTMHVCNPDGSNICTEILKARDNMERRSLEELKSEMKRKFEGRIHASNIDIDIPHKSAQFQSVYRDILYLNQLLLQPICIPDPRNMINGTLIWNVFHLLADNEHSETLLGGETSPLFELFNTWLETISQLCQLCTRDKCPVASTVVTYKVNPENKYRKLKVISNNAK